MDPRGDGTNESGHAHGSVTIELNYTAANLLARLCADLDTDDAVGVLSRALGVLDLAVSCKRRGGRLCLVNQRGELSDVVF